MQKPEIQRILKELSAKNTYEQKEKAAYELQAVFYKYVSVSEEIFTKLQKMINSADMNEKQGGIIGLDYLTSAIQESQVLTFVNRFLSVVFSQFQINTDERLLRKNAEVFGKLLRQGGSKIAQLVDQHFVDAFKWVKQDSPRERKLAGLLVLREILIEAPSITFNKIFSQANNLGPVLQAIRSKHLALREAALEFFEECIKQVSQREVKYQQDVLLGLYNSEIKRTLASKEEEVIHGNILMIKILLTYSKEEVFVNQIREQGQYVINKRDSRSQLVIRAVIETLPTLSKYSKGQFLVDFIDTSITFLLQNRYHHPLTQKSALAAKVPKDKSLCYSTLSELFAPLDESIAREKAKTVVKHIREELLLKTKPFCVETIQCLRTIFQIHHKRFAEFTSIDVLVDVAAFSLTYQQILLNGLHSQSVNFLNELCKAMPQNSDYIQYKLLQTIAAILIRKIITFVSPGQKSTKNNQEFDIKVLEGFQNNLSDALQSPEFTNTEAIANAIQTLSTFVFENQQDNLAVFVKDAVLPYLSNPNPIIRKATAKAGCLLYVKKSKSLGQQMISKNVMYEILDKFMNVAISDIEQDIRQTMLASLNENFDQYLNAPNNLRKLFLCMNDPVPEVQEIALTILCRLSILNPSDIVPFLKKTLFEYLQTLTYDSNQPDKQTINQLYLLSSLIKHGRDIVQPYSQNIANVLLQHLRNPNTSAAVISYLLAAFSQLTENQKVDILIYLNEIIEIIICAMQDKSSTMKRESAIKSLNEIIKNTGFVVLPYYNFPNLMDTLMQLVRTEVTQEMRFECLRLLGNLGAIDSFNYKKTVGRIRNNQTGGLSLFPQKFRFIQRYTSAMQSHRQNELVTEMHSYYEDLILLGNFQDQKRMFMHLATLKKEAQSTQGLLFNLSNNASSNPNAVQQQPQQQSTELQYYQQAIQNPELEQLFSQATVIKVGDLEYYSTVVIKTLLMVLLDQSLQPHHELALETLMWIIGTLKIKTSQYLQYLIPVFARLLQRIEDIREKVLSSLEKVIRLCGIHFGQQYIDQVIGCVMLFGQGKATGSMQENQASLKAVSIGMEILGTLIQFSKSHLRHKIEPVVRMINNQIVIYEEQKEVIKKAISIYRALEELLDAQLHMIIPFMCKLMQKEVQSIDLEVRREIIHLFVNLSQNCPSTVQYLSLIVSSLINLMELVAKQPQSQQTHQTVMNCFSILIKQYRNVVLVYLPLINQAVQRYKINHNQYQECIRIFLHYGTLEDINNLLDEQQDFAFFPKPSATLYTIEQVPPMYKNLDSEELMSKFDTSTRTLKDEWIEWMRNTSVELLKQSPMLVLSPCSSIAEMYPQLANELYNIAFDSVWQKLNDKHKEQMITHLTNAIHPRNAENIPLSILQIILNLAEFMQHDKEGLQIDISTLAELAERCMAFAKALYYREHEFEYASYKTIQSLISLYTSLGLPESANGLLTFAKQNLKIQMKITDYERLQKWDEALDDYRKQQLNSAEDQQDQFFLPKMRCFNALMQWNQLINQVDKVFDNNANIDAQKQVSHLAANAAMHLGQWEKLERYNEKVGTESVDKPLWNAAISIHKNDLETARMWVAKSRERLDAQVSGLLLESYERAQEGILKLQQLTEMEEIIDLKTFENKVEKASLEFNGEYQYMKMVEELNSRKQRLQDIWSDRLHGAPKEVEVWYKILSTRQLYQPKIKDLDTWIKFARLALKRKKMVLCQDTLEMLRAESLKNDGDQGDDQVLPYKLYLITLECEYMHKKNEKDIVEKVRSYFKFQDKQADNNTQESLLAGISSHSKVKAKTFFTLGSWVYERTESFTKENLEQINNLFDESLQYNPSYAKAWHHYALTNFEAVENFSQQLDLKQDPEMVDLINKHVFAAVRGFSKSISLGFKYDKRGRFILQDTLRLLSMIFKYGHLDEVAKEFTENYKSIDIIAWINVVPQILARIQIQNLTIQGLLHHLLIHISRVHPQALIYPLTVACKSKNQIRRVAVLRILNDMKTHSHILVNEALLISEELNRTAILLKESWKEGIQEAWNSYYQDKNKAHVERILRGLHDNMRVNPESLSEISFHQTYGAEIFEAEAWFQRYLKTDDEVCLCQAFDIYYQIYRKISVLLDNLKTVHLENVSPKLLATSNCEISVPGLFRPNGILVKISRFQPKLQVLTSKQHPRKVFIYGNDGKEYHFLLKGHEDLRQDERVMQLFSLVNRLLNNDPETERKDLVITKYSVIPLSHNTGIIGWVQNCDTLQQLIREYRESSQIRSNTESYLMSSFCDKYELLPLANKVEIFRNILENTRGEDIQKVLWLKSQNSETWLERRTNYTRSLATMSMVGYILGLGDRHPSNIMLQRYTGKIVHIDFGDCFEVAMKREKFPEKVPFRLTRMLVKAMEACGIEGVYRHTCNIVMRVLRDNKESLLAVLDSFVYDPLLTWRLLNTASNIPRKEKDKIDIQKTYPQFLQEKTKDKDLERDRGASLIQKNIPQTSRNSMIQQEQHVIENDQKDQQKMETPKRKESGRQKELYLEFADEEREIPDDLQNQKGLEVIDRIKKKLLGKDFRETDVLKYEEQVRQLILQATSHENISQAYIGWCPFW